MQQLTISFIGGGNMARSLIGGLIKQGYHANNIRVIEPDARTAATLSLDFDIITYPEATRENLNSDYLIVAVKPQILKTVCTDLAPLLNDSTTSLISIAAGIRTTSIRTWVNNKDIDIIRAMPNTPALISLSATGLFSNSALSPIKKQAIDHIFSSIGLSIWVDNEQDMDTVTALSGSGPAYFFLFCEQLVKAGIDAGLNHEQAHKLVVQTAVGAAHMALMSKLKPETNTNPLSLLRGKVTSKGGTTQAGLEVFADDNFATTIAKVIQRAKDRSIELSSEYGS